MALCVEMVELKSEDEKERRKKKEERKKEERMKERKKEMEWSIIVDLDQTK